MAESGIRTGRCLCGAASYRVTKPAHEVEVCHCGMCRRWNGGPAFALKCGTDVAFQGEDNIVRYKSSDWAERGFCASCGSNLFYFLTGDGQYFINAGTLDDQTGLEITEQIFIDAKPDFYSFANQTRMLTGAEVFAMHAPKEEG